MHFRVYSRMDGRWLAMPIRVASPAFLAREVEPDLLGTADVEPRELSTGFVRQIVRDGYAVLDPLDVPVFRQALEGRSDPSSPTIH